MKAISKSFEVMFAATMVAVSAISEAAAGEVITSSLREAGPKDLPYMFQRAVKWQHLPGVCSALDDLARNGVSAKGIEPWSTLRGGPGHRNLDMTAFLDGNLA